MPSKPTPDESALISLLRESEAVLNNAAVICDGNPAFNSVLTGKAWRTEPKTVTAKHPRELLARVREEISVQRSLQGTCRHCLPDRQSQNEIVIVVPVGSETRVAVKVDPSLAQKLICFVFSADSFDFTDSNVILAHGVSFAANPSKDGAGTVSHSSCEGDAK